MLTEQERFQVMSILADPVAAEDFRAIRTAMLRRGCQASNSTRLAIPVVLQLRDERDLRFPHLSHSPS